MIQIKEVLRLDNLLSDDFADYLSPLSRFLLGRTDAVPDVKGATADDLIKMREDLRARFGNDEAGREFCVTALGRLTSNRFACKSQGFAATNLTLEKLSNAISQKLPIIFTFGFGGYKNHNSPEYPEPGWAEFFAIKHIIKYLGPIIKNYQHGVIVEFESEEICVQFNNVPQSGTDKYTSAFKKLLQYFRDKTGVDLRLVISRDQYPGGAQALYDLMKQKTAEHEKTFSQLSPEQQTKWIQRAENNLMIAGTKDYTNATPAEIAEVARQVRIMNEVFLDADYILRAEYWDQENRVVICGTWGIMPSAFPVELALHIMSTSSSLTDFWIGTGVLNGTHKDILSKTQFDAIADKIEYIDVDSDLKSISDNFKKIPVIK